MRLRKVGRGTFATSERENSIKLIDEVASAYLKVFGHELRGPTKRISSLQSERFQQGLNLRCPVFDQLRDFRLNLLGRDAYSNLRVVNGVEWLLEFDELTVDFRVVLNELVEPLLGI